MSDALTLYAEAEAVRLKKEAEMIAFAQQPTGHPEIQAAIVRNMQAMLAMWAGSNISILLNPNIK